MNVIPHLNCIQTSISKVGYAKLEVFPSTVSDRVTWTAVLTSRIHHWNRSQLQWEVRPNFVSGAMHVLRPL